MTLSTGLAACALCAAACLVALGHRPSRRRLAKLPLTLVKADAGAPSATPSPTVGEAAGDPRRRWPDRRRWGAALAGLVLAVAVGGWFGVAAGLGGAVALDRGMRRLPTAHERSRRLVEEAELPLVADLLAVALRAGAPMERAAAAVAEAMPGPLAARLNRVARILQLGGTPGEAWAEFAALPGGHRFAGAAVRSAEHGSALAGTLSRLAEDLRAQRAISVEATARRAGVLIVLPLALCFLPAFILAGLVPVIVAVLGDVLSLEKGTIQ